jgi:hypothetical protein
LGGYCREERLILEYVIESKRVDIRPIIIEEAITNEAKSDLDSRRQRLNGRGDEEEDVDQHMSKMTMKGIK